MATQTRQEMLINGRKNLFLKLFRWCKPNLFPMHFLGLNFLVVPLRSHRVVSRSNCWFYYDDPQRIHLSQSWFPIVAFTTVSVDFADIELRANSIQAFYIASTGQVASLEDNVDDPLASDGRLKLLNPTRGVTETQFGVAYSNVLSWWVLGKNTIFHM